MDRSSVVPLGREKKNNVATRTILLAEGTSSLLRLYQTALGLNGHNILCADTAAKALELARHHRPDFIVTELSLPDMGGIELIAQLRQMRVVAPFIIVSDKGSLNSAIEAMKSGATDFLVKPFAPEKLLGAVEAELRKSDLHTMPHELAGLPFHQQDTGERRTSQRPAEFGAFVGTSPAMTALYHRIECAAHSHAPVFITGETGTGKEVCAEAIHKHSPRHAHPFIAINCAAIPRDLMESELFGHVKGAFTGAIADREGAARLADGGTLFLDEIAEMKPDMQTKLLRFLQSQSFMKIGGSKLEKTDLRIICATNRDPGEEIRAGRFREDLFYRLHVLPLHMPPLRERGDDVTDLAQLLLRRYAGEEGKSFRSFTAEAEALLRRYDWPGNIRQLQNIIRHVVVMNTGEVVGTELLDAALYHNPEYRALPLSGPSRPPGHEKLPVTPTDTLIRPLADIEREAIEAAIALCNGNIPSAAARLGLSPSTLYRKKAVWDGTEAGEAP